MKNKRIKRLAIFMVGLTAVAFGACGGETPSTSSTSAPEKTVLTEVQWETAFLQVEETDKLAAEITYSYNVASDDLTTAWTIKMDGNIEYQKEVIGDNKYVYEGYSVYDDDAMTMVNYRLDGANSTWKKRTNTYTEANYPAAKKDRGVLHSLGFYYAAYSLREGDATKHALADLFSVFVYDEDSRSYSATLYIRSEDGQASPVYTATKFTCKFENQRLVQIINEYEYNGVQSVTTVKLTAGESLTVPQSVIEGATEWSGDKK